MAIFEPKNTPISQINREFEEREVIKNANKLGYPYVDIGKVPFNNIDILKTVSQIEAKKAKLIPFYHDKKVLKVAAIDPKTEKTRLLAEKLKSEKLNPEIHLCSQSGLKEAMEAYKSELLNKKKVRIRSNFEEESTETLEHRVKTFQELKRKISILVPEKAINEIELTAIASRVSDIHFQPMNDEVLLRFRIDGVLHPVLTITYEKAKKIITRIKYESGMQSNLSDIPQDGRITIGANSRRIDIRVSTLPTENLDSVVMRILDPQNGIKDFKELGFSDPAKAKISEALEQKEGMVLVTGPTGCGKTTTLYSMISGLNSPSRKLVTLENPVEYHMEGVSQSPINEKQGYTFSSGLKALLWHDPDVILIGEIRGLPTAKLVSEASLTGHIVFSSLHTNSAVGAIARLRSMGLEDYNIASSLNAVFAQRLVRKVCGCAKMKPITKDLKLLKSIKQLKKVAPNLNILKEIPEKVGCEACYHTGYLGRSVICESFLVTKELKKLILKGKSDVDIEKYLREKTDFLSLYEDGILKVLSGKTTLEEIYRVTG